MKVSICFPYLGDVKARFMLSVVANVLKLKEVAPGIEIGMTGVNGSDLAAVRNEVVRRALTARADWLFLADTDHEFPAETVLRLLSHGKPLVGCNYRRRNNGEPMVEPKEGLEQVRYLGLGVCLVQRQVFEAIPQPWFAFANGKGEDFNFFDKAAAHGFLPWCDHDLSREVGHIAETVLKL